MVLILSQIHIHFYKYPRVAALILGLIASLAIPPLSLLPLFWIGFGGLVVLLARLNLSHLRAHCVGWFAFGWTVFSLHWIANSMFVDIEMHWPWIVPTLIGMPLVHGVLYGLIAMGCFFIADRLFRRATGDDTDSSLVLMMALLPTIWVFGENTRHIIFSGFTWNPASIVWTETPLMLQAARYVGSQGLSVVTLFAGSSIGLLAARKATLRLWGYVGPAVCLGGLFFVGVMSLSSAPKLSEPIVTDHGNWKHVVQLGAPHEAQTELKVRIIQSAIPQHVKWDPMHRQRIFSELIALTRVPVAKSFVSTPLGTKGVDVIVWPEAAFTGLLESDDNARQMIAQAGRGAYMLIGGLKRVTSKKVPPDIQNGQIGLGDKPQYYNSIFALDADGHIIDRYDKMRLVPFGEYIPSGPFGIGLDQAIEAIAGYGSAFVSGQTVSPLLKTSPASVLPMVCYESTFGVEPLGKDSEEELRWMVNVSNNAWFGSWIGPVQHERNSRMRALETGLPFLQATNMGESTAVDPWGRIIASAKTGDTAVIDVNVPASIYAPVAFMGARLTFFACMISFITSVCILLIRTGAMLSQV